MINRVKDLQKYVRVQHAKSKVHQPYENEGWLWEGMNRTDSLM